MLWLVLVLGPPGNAVGILGLTGVFEHVKCHRVPRIMDSDEEQQQVEPPTPNKASRLSEISSIVAAASAAYAASGKMP